MHINFYESRWQVVAAVYSTLFSLDSVRMTSMAGPGGVTFSAACRLICRFADNLVKGHNTQPIFQSHCGEE